MPETLPAWLTHAWLSVPLPVALGLLVEAGQGAATGLAIGVGLLLL